MLLRAAVASLDGNPYESEASKRGNASRIEDAIGLAKATLRGRVRGRLEPLLRDTSTDACRRAVGETFRDTYDRVLTEAYTPFEFETLTYISDCDRSSEADVESKPRIPADEIRLCYLMLVHEAPERVARVVEALSEEDSARGLGRQRHTFVIHVDRKSPDTYEALVAYASDKEHVSVLDDARRVSVSWGGFNVVEATLNGMEHILETLDSASYDWIATLSGATYPLASNAEIRETLAHFPADSEFVEIRPEPFFPGSLRSWNQFVECDDRLRRIWRLVPMAPVKFGGLHMHIGSQWFFATEAFAKYALGRGPWAGGRVPKKRVLPHPYPPGTEGLTFAKRYRDYARNVVIADENYFSTLLQHSPMCHNHVRNNFLYVEFGDFGTPEFRPDRCLQPNTEHCGRSPDTFDVDDLDGLYARVAMGGTLFARKFDDPAVLDAIDEKRRGTTVNMTDVIADLRYVESDYV